MIGVLWMDDSGTDLAKKVQDAARCYQLRFGKGATLCYANPSIVPEPVTIGKIRVEPRANIQRNYFLVGREPEQPLPEEIAA